MRTDQDRKEEGRLIQHVETMYRGPWARARAPIVKQYLMNHSYLNGFPYVRATSSGLENIPRGTNKYKVRSNINILKPVVRSLLGQVMGGRSQIDVLPNTPDFKDEALSGVAEQIARSLKRIVRADRVTQRNWISMFKGGTTLLRCLWNADRGVPSEAPVLDSNGEELSFDLEDNKERPASEVSDIMAALNLEIEAAEEMQEIRFIPLTEPTFPGDVELDLYSVLEFMVNPMFLCLDDADMVLVERARPLEWIRANRAFQNVDEVVGDPNAIILFDRGGTGRVAPGVGLPRTTGNRHSVLQGVAPDYGIVRELLIRPTRSNPLLAEFGSDGRRTKDGPPASLGVHYVWCGNVELLGPENPLPYANTPQTNKHDVNFDFSDYRFFPDESFYGSPLLSDGLPLVRSINRRDSQIKEGINATVHAKGLIPVGSRIRRSTITDQAGDWIEYSGEKPSYMEPPSIRPYVLQTIDLDTRHFNDVLMTHEVTRQGVVPANVRTADGLRSLQETDAIPLRPTMLEFEASEERTYQMVLDRVQQWYEEDRVIYYAGEKNRLETFMFKNADFFQHSWKVSIRRGSAMPRSRAAQVAEAREMAQFAPWFFVDPQTRMPDRSLWARAVGREDLEDFIQEEDESRKAAESEHAELDLGPPIVDPQTQEPRSTVTVRPYELHNVHLRAHYAVLRSSDFRAKDDEIAQNWLMHISEHEQAMQKQAQMMAQASAGIQDAAKKGENAVREQAAAAGAASEARKVAREEMAKNKQQPAPEQEQPQRQPQANGGGGAQAAPQLIQQLLARRATQ